MIRKAILDDVHDIHRLLALYSEKGELLARPLHKIYDHLRDFWIYEEPETRKALGCCALQFCWENLAEIRSLAVDPDATGKGVGTALAEKAIKEAVDFKVSDLFTLTYRPDFFKRFDFSIIDKNDLPLKIWADCIGCVRFPDCDEIAMLKKL